MSARELRSVAACISFALTTCVIWGAGFNVAGEQLPIKTYTTANGLARDEISRIVQDSFGFLWFCTSEGLSRFDGYQFTNYGRDQGLSHRVVKDMLETRDGNYWVATGGGLCRFERKGYAHANFDKNSRYREGASSWNEARFVVYYPSDDKRSHWINRLIEDRNGVIWCATERGLYRLDQVDGQWSFSFVDIGLPMNASREAVVYALLEDRQGGLWIGSASGLFRLWPDGRLERYTTHHGLPFNTIKALMEDRQGQLWVGTAQGLCRLAPNPKPTRTATARVYTTRDGLPSNRLTSLFQSSDGRLWAGTVGGLAEFIPAKQIDDERFRSYTTAHGLSDTQIESIAEDRNGNIWIGTETGGAMKFATEGFTNFGLADGLRIARIASISETRDGELCVIDSMEGDLFINRFDGRRFSAIRPAVPAQIKNFGWGWSQIGFQDRLGEWWIPTAHGLCRYPKARIDQLSSVAPKNVYTTRDGLPSNEIFRVYEDSRGDIWIGCAGYIADSLARWDRATGKLRLYTTANGLPREDGPTAFCEDAGGNLWIGYYGGGLARFVDGRFTFFSIGDGTPTGMIRGLYTDRSGRLWIATAAGGVVRADDPTANSPHFISYTTADGISSNQVSCITEDEWGRIYIGTGRGLDRLDPATGRIKHYSVTDGLGNNFVNVAYRDRDGALWFGTLQGLSRFVPKPDRPQAPPPIFIGGLRITGVEQTLSDLGEAKLSGFELGPSQNQIEIGFLGLGYGSGESLRYQYKLEGADQDWTQPTDQRTVNYANLQPGSYRFLVRAVNADGVTSPVPASLEFTIIPPIWQRWWFVSLAAILVALAAYGIYRHRVTRLIELERVRMRIATDLHDDIGSSLSQISVLSEVINKRLGKEQSVAEPLLMIGSLSRDLVDSLNDIVWAINPRRDRLSDLIYRMRRFASDTFTARDIQFRFSAPDSQNHLRLGADTRREVFLVFKEAVNNLVRHSGCTVADIDFGMKNGRMELSVTDNGAGFNPERESEGNGLVNMRQRAAKVGGGLDIVSSRDRGTTVLLKVPLR